MKDEGTGLKCIINLQVIYAKLIAIVIVIVSKTMRLPTPTGQYKT
jgi:hypothetical protein